MKKWNVLYQNKNKKINLKNEEILQVLLQNRGIKTKKEIKEFLNPNLSEISIKSVGIKKQNTDKALKRIRIAIEKKELIIIFGDYDVDGICATAILWETINDLGGNVFPFIPSRFEEGYGLSVKGIENLISQKPKTSLIITVDNGIVANEAVDYANNKGVDVIITDHHMPDKKIPKAYSIVHTTNVCGAGVAYLLSKEIKDKKLNLKNDDTHLELVCLATIADLVPLRNANRAFVYFGLETLRNTKRVGLLELFRKTALVKEKIGVFEVGHIIAPRLNAMGRLYSAMDSLRLICTKSKDRAQELAAKLSSTNLERQEITAEMLFHAKDKAKEKIINNLIFIADESYKQGVVGLVAGRLVEEFYLPSIVVSKGKIYSRASARSVAGFNIIEFLRQASDLMVDIGGHPMAAGFTVETKNLELLKKRLYKNALSQIKKSHLERVLNIDLELVEDLILPSTYQTIQKLGPFGMANPEPLFMTKNLQIVSLGLVGKEQKHLKLKLSTINRVYLDVIAFGMGQDSTLKVGDNISIAYVLEVNEWNGSKRLQLEVKDIKLFP